MVIEMPFKSIFNTKVDDQTRSRIRHYLNFVTPEAAGRHFYIRPMVKLLSMI